MMGIVLRRALVCGAAVVLSLALAASGNAQAVTYSYDGLGRIVTVTYPDGKQIVYSYDAAGNRTQHVVSASTVNRAPVAVDDNKTVTEGTPLNFDPRTNDSDPDSNPLTITNVSNGQHGTASIGGGGTSLTYTTTKGRVASDAITYAISDGNGMSASATVSITIANAAPAVANDSITATESQNPGVTFDPRTNDSDPGLDPFTITAKTNGTKGTVVIGSGGTSLTYTPTATMYGADSFTYTVTDDEGGAATGTVNVTINSTNQAPVAVNNSENINRNQAKTFDPRSNDSDPDGDAFTITAKTNGTKGTVTIGSGGTSVTYTPNFNALGADSFTYTISDPENATATATVSIDIQDTNNPPVAVADSAWKGYMNQSQAWVTIDPRWNDSDADGDSLLVTAKTNGTYGTVTILSGGTQVKYQRTSNFPPSNQSADDTYTYTISDGRGGTAVGSVTVTVENMNCGGEPCP
jgi:YD repeat-containing protein